MSSWTLLTSTFLLLTERQTSPSLCLLRTYSPSPVVVLLLQVELKEVQLKLADEVEIVGLTDESSKTVVTGIEMFRKILDYAEAGDNIGALLRGIQRTEIERGQVLC